MSEDNTQDQRPFEIEDLEFEPRLIAKLEKEYKQMLMEIVANFSMETLVRLIRAGSNNCTEDEAYSRIKHYLKASSDRDTFKMQIEIMNRLEEQGFLSKEIQVGQTINKKVQEMKNQLAGTSEILG